YGGKEGQRAQVCVVSPQGSMTKGLPFYIQIVKPDTQIIIESSGGGGWGNPLERKIEAVRKDVLNGLISPERALKVYGVKIDPISGKVDMEETLRIRNKLLKEMNNLSERT
ncbi:MAG: hypothetical protein ACXQS8_04680, partial [Candidatus Helarchaeales archaeon]